MISRKEFNLDRQLVFLLWDVHKEHLRISSGRGSQERILGILKTHGDMAQKELTLRLDVQPGTISATLGRLEKHGLIRRILNENDRRGFVVQLTEVGERKAEEIIAQRAMRHQKMFQILSDEEKKTFLSLMQKTVDYWKDSFP